MCICNGRKTGIGCRKMAQKKLEQIKQIITFDLLGLQTESVAGWYKSLCFVLFFFPQKYYHCKCDEFSSDKVVRGIIVRLCCIVLWYINSIIFQLLSLVHTYHWYIWTDNR